MPACAGGGLTRVIVVCPTDLRCRLYTRVGLRNFLAFLLSPLSAVKRAREIACAVSPIAVAAISTIVMLCDTFKELRGDRKATTPTSATGGEKMPLPWNEAMSAFRQVQCLPQRPKWARNAAVRKLMRGRRLRRADRFVLPRARTNCCRDVHFLGQNNSIMYRRELPRILADLALASMRQICGLHFSFICTLNTSQTKTDDHIRAGVGSFKGEGINVSGFYICIYPWTGVSGALT